MEKNKNKLKQKEISPEEIGLSPASMDPIKTIEMEGALFRGLTRGGKKPLWVRIFSIFFGIFLFGAGLLYTAGGYVGAIYENDLA